MAIDTRRQYITEDQIEEFSNITVTDANEATDRANWAEEMIDAYVGPQQKHVNHRYEGKATGGTTTTLIDTSSDSSLNYFEDDYFTYCEVEIIGGTNKGQKRRISAYDKSTNTVTVSSAFSSAIDNTSVYVIRQLGKFPRREDVHHIDTEDKYYKTIPEAVTRATLAQLEYIIEKGDDFFAGASEYQSESIGSYSYTMKEGRSANRLISPHAKELLRGIMNRKGRMIV